MITTTEQALQTMIDFIDIGLRGGHAAIDFYAGELHLTCTKPNMADKSTWGKGVIPQTMSNHWVRIRETQNG